MTRKRAGTKSKKTFERNKYKILAVITIIIIITVSGAALTLYDFPVEDQKEEGGTEGKWLFAMDTANIRYMYSANGIPTLVIIDREGEVIYYNQGAHSKDQLMPYIDSALKGTAESLGQSIDFTVSTFNNEEFTLSNCRGKVVLLDIMGVGCYPCEMQMPELQKIKIEKGDEIIILSIDTYYSGETKEDVIETYGEYILR